MQNLYAIYASFSVNGGCQVYHPGAGRVSPQVAFWSGRKMVMTIRAGLDCHALEISLQQLPAGIPAQHLGVIVSAVCGNGTIN